MTTEKFIPPAKLVNTAFIRSRVRFISENLLIEDISNMDLNKAMVELYKQRRSSAGDKNKRHKTDDMAVKTEPTLKVDNPRDKKQAKIEELLSSMTLKPTITFDKLYGCELARDQILNIVKRFKRAVDGNAKRSDWPNLICGSHGLGKTVMVEAAANYADINLVVIPLKQLVEQTRNEFKVTVNILVKHCIANQPSMVLIDDLEQLKDKEEMRYIIRSALKRLLEGANKILVFCTTSSVVDGTFDIDFLFTIHLKRPDIEARGKIMESLRQKNKNLASITLEDIKSLAIQTPSFTALDLNKMLDIAETESSGMPTLENCEKAVDMVKSSFKRGTHLIGERPSVTWNDIGGLPEVRREFAEIRRQIKKGDMNCKFAGIALYGPPGCGKTMVAQAMANEAGLNFISIKPAELVDKFLGETEKNIRRVFSEAQEHEPCMIYFDEFDGLCGTRGNRDNVTSAIQTLLSEMDGFANRGKSIILASTNRLEDIDPAMKRPGRLSKHIFVGPPDERARREILDVIISRLSSKLSSEIKLDTWASRTQGFTGADLDFFISEAMSKAFSTADYIDESFQDSGITLTNEHLEFALNKIRSTNMVLSEKTKTLKKNL